MARRGSLNGKTMGRRQNSEPKSSSPYIVPLFISHQGCPNRCVFCNQVSITGQSGPDESLRPERVRAEIETILSRPRDPEREVHAAFYGGSFTGLPLPVRTELLGVVSAYRKEGKVHRIRLSTRPDYVDEEIVSFLREHGVDIVELGIQSLNQDVLDRCRRGHTAGQVVTALHLLLRAGFTVGAQLMLGLPGESTTSMVEGAEKLARLQPHFVRLYPALVIRGSELEQMMKRGEYTPLSPWRAIASAARLKSLFAYHGIPVIRIGLQPNDSLRDTVVAGPYHPAFGELVLSRIFFTKIRRLLTVGQVKRLAFSSADESLFRGHRNASVKRLRALGLLDNVKLDFQSDLCRGKFMADNDFHSVMGARQ